MAKVLLWSKILSSCNLSVQWREGIWIIRARQNYSHWALWSARSIPSIFLWGCTNRIGMRQTLGFIALSPLTQLAGHIDGGIRGIEKKHLWAQVLLLGQHSSAPAFTIVCAQTPQSNPSSALSIFFSLNVTETQCNRITLLFSFGSFPLLVPNLPLLLSCLSLLPQAIKGENFKSTQGS